MSELDRKISEKLAGLESAPAPADMKAVMDAVKLEQRKLKWKMRWWSVVWHLIFLAPLLIGVWIIFKGDNINDVGDGIFVCTAALTGLAIIKLIYFAVQVRMRIELQLEQLDLAVAEVRDSIHDLKK